MSQLKGKVAVVTGASKGIGAGIAISLAAGGAAVVVNYGSSKEGAERTVNEIKAHGGQAIAVQGHVEKEADVQKLFDETKKVFGRLDVLVNNAGVYTFGPIEKTTEAEYRRQFDTNVLGTLVSIREALKLFGPEGGSIINLSSIASQTPMPYSAIYSGTKGAIDSITRSLSAELGPRKIRVNAISPGPTDTEGIRSHPENLPGDMEKQVVASTPLGRLGQPDDMGDAVLFLASDQARWVTGETIRVSGGKR